MNLSLDKSSGILLAFLCLLMPLFLLNNVKYIAFALIPLVLFFFNEHKQLKLLNNDLFFLSYIIFSFCSSYWSANRSFVWTPAFTNLTLFGVYFLIRQYVQDDLLKWNLVRFIQFLFLFALSQHIIALLMKVPLNTSWNAFFGKNVNYTASYLAMLFPFILFDNSSFKSSIKLVLSLLTFAVIFVLGSRAALLSFSFLFLIWFYKLFCKRYRVCLIFFLIAIFIALSLFYFINDSFLDISGGDQTRLYLIKNSINLWLDKPLFGHGLGTWPLLAFQSSMNDVLGMNLQTEFFNHTESHNWYFKVLVEQGFVGACLFFMPFVIVLLENIKKGLSDFDLIFVSSLFVFLIQCMFYAATTFSIYHFSSLNFLAFVNLGILSSNLIGKKISSSSVIVYIIVGASVISLFWFSLLMYANYTYISARQHINVGRLEEAKEKLLYIYKPNIFTHYNHKTSLALIISDLSDIEDEKLKYLQHASADDSNNLKVKFNLAKYYIQEKNDASSGLGLLNNILAIQPAHIPSNLLFAEGSYLVKNFSEVRKSLNRVWRQEYLYQRRYLECQLYISDYISDLLRLTDEEGIVIKVNCDVLIPEFDQSFLKLDNQGLSPLSGSTIDVLKKEVVLVGRKTDRCLSSYLNDTDFLLYLKDKYRKEFQYQYMGFSNILSLNIDQKESIQDLFEEFWITLKFLSIKELDTKVKGEVIVDFVNLISIQLSDSQKQILNNLDF